MGIRTAIGQTWIGTFAVLAATAWILLSTYEVATTFDWTAWTPAEFVGQTAVSGVVGLVVMVLLLGLLVVLYGEMSETDPSPTPWPPE